MHRFSCIRYLWVMFFLTPQFIAQPCRGGQDGIAMSLLKKESAGGWAKLRNDLLNMKAHFVDHSAFFEPSSLAETKISDQVGELNGKRGCLQYQKKRSGEFGFDEFACGVNEHYAFTAGRKDPNEPFRVTYCGREKELVLERISQHSIVFTGVMLHWAPVEKLFSHSSFKLVSASLSGSGNERRIDVSYNSNFEVKRGYTILGGQISFDPSMHWAVTRYRSQIKYDDDNIGYVTGSAEYRRINDQVCPTRVVQEDFVGDASTPCFRRVIEYSDCGTGDVNCSKCTMSEFGMMEPGIKSFDRGQLFWMVVLNVSGFACLAMVLLIRKLTKRENPRSAA